MNFALTRISSIGWFSRNPVHASAKGQAITRYGGSFALHQGPLSSTAFKWPAKKASIPARFRWSLSK